MRNSSLRWIGAAAVLFVAGLPLSAQGRGPGQGTPPPDPHAYQTEADPPPVKTHHSITVNGTTLSYTATVGKLAVPDETGKTEGHMFYVAYTLDGENAAHPRPVTFSYNGGPGSDSVFVHMGGFGPRRVLLNDDGSMPSPPYQIVDNADTWLNASDLVFIDAMGTGYSRASSRQDLERTSSAAGDLQAFSQFIRLYLYQNHRTNSPVILAGESYGTFRSAGLADELLTHHVTVNGVVLISSVLNMQALSPSLSDDRPYWLALPTLTAIAYEHKKLPANLQSQPIEKVIQESKDWASSKYEHYLDLGDALQGAERTQAVREMANFTGLKTQLLDDYNLRIGTFLFNTELLRDEKEIVGRYDGGQVGNNRTPGAQFPDYDPSDLIEVPYVHEFVNYLQNELNYHSDSDYGLGGAGITNWKWNLSSGRFGGFGGGQGNDVSSMLADAFSKNRTMKLMLVEGYYDNATPMFQADYSMRHLFLPPSLQKNISIQHYKSGHMVYIRKAPRAKLHADFDAFVKTLAGVQ